MNEKNDFALVPRPPSAVEKAEAGAKRILSGMVADTLALAKKAPAAKKVFSVGTCGGPLTTEALQILISSPLKRILGDSCAVELSTFEYTEDLLGTVSNFDLLFVFRWPCSPLIARALTSLCKGKPDPHRLIAELRSKFGKPIIIIGLESWCRQIADADPGWRESGADAYFEVDFSTESFVVPEVLNRALETCVAKSQTTGQSVEKPVGTTLKSARTHPLRIVLVKGDADDLKLDKECILQLSKDVTLLAFQDGKEAWQELLRAEPDLFITDLNRRDDACALLRLLAERNATYPILVLSGFSPESANELVLKHGGGANLNVTCASPFTWEELRQVLSSVLTQAAEQAGIAAEQIYKEKTEVVTETLPDVPRRTRPLRIVVVDDEPLMLELYEKSFRVWFKEASVLKFQDGTQALQELLRADIDLVITDMFRPGLDGWELLPLLAERKVKYPILVVSGGAQEKEVLRCAGPDLNVTFLRKPLQPEQLRRELLKLIGPADRESRSAAHPH